MGNLNPTFGRLIDFDFASRVTGIEITENVEDPESLLFENKEYSRNVASLGSGTFDGSNGLPGLSAFEKPNPRNRNIFFRSYKIQVTSSGGTCTQGQETPCSRHYCVTPLTFAWRDRGRSLWRED